MYSQGNINQMQNPVHHVPCHSTVPKRVSQNPYVQIIQATSNVSTASCVKKDFRHLFKRRKSSNKSIKQIHVKNLPKPLRKKIRDRLDQYKERNMGGRFDEEDSIVPQDWKKPRLYFFESKSSFFGNHHAQPSSSANVLIIKEGVDKNLTIIELKGLPQHIRTKMTMMKKFKSARAKSI